MDIPAVLLELFTAGVGDLLGRLVVNVVTGFLGTGLEGCGGIRCQRATSYNMARICAPLST